MNENVHILCCFRNRAIAWSLCNEMLQREMFICVSCDQMFSAENFHLHNNTCITCVLRTLLFWIDLTETAEGRLFFYFFVPFCLAYGLIRILLRLSYVAWQ